MLAMLLKQLAPDLNVEEVVCDFKQFALMFKELDERTKRMEESINKLNLEMLDGHEKIFKFR